jgi:hypothetical protein
MKIEVNHFAAWCIKQVFLIIGSIAICFITSSAWGILGFFFLSTLSTKNDDTENK